MRPDRAPSTVHARWLPGSVNAALLALSFALGQGSIFLVQTWMIDRDALALLASFATHFSFAILALMIVDMGSAVVVARRISLAHDHDVVMVARRCYWQACAVRLCVAALVSLAGVGCGFLSSDAFSRGYIPAAMPALFFWACNATGVLDGLGLSGISGLTTISAYIASALALAIAGPDAAPAAGLVLGAALSLGYAIAVAAQLATLWRLGRLPRPLAVAVADCHAFAGEGAAVLLSTLPGQLSFRFQIIVCSVALGPAATALFLYARQIAAAVSQLLEFVRRAHFPVMVRALEESGASIIAALQAQTLATWMAMLSSSGLLLAGALCFLLVGGAFAQPAWVVSLFSVGVLTGALSQTLAQAAQGLGRYRIVAGAALTAMLIGFVASAVLGLSLGLAGLAISEVLTHGVGALLIYRLVFRRSGHRVLLQAGA
jgi:O-antigen/teichoic acid export membrane protein